jgi:phosphatidylserine/phosphatidylglycerophosphate/cardiolipin synthase-like enzyme
MSSYLEEQSQIQRRRRKRWIWGAFLVWWVGTAAWHTNKPMPAGTDAAAPMVTASSEQVRFLYDLTYADAFRIIDEADSFIVVDFFLVNELMGASGGVHRPLSRQLVDRLIARKNSEPKVVILFITDPINEVYGGMTSALLGELRSAGIDVVVTNLEALRDSNPLYSPFWRTFVQWWGNSAEEGWMPNPFAPNSKITLRSWLALLNFKANHRKVVVADRADKTLTALVTSANPHDASSAHSNVALRVEGPTARQILESEMALARFSGWRGHIYADTLDEPQPQENKAATLQFVTEESIRDHLLREMSATRSGDSISIATFYLSDREVIEGLLAAAARKVRVRLILDSNRDAFGRQKDGVPNRPVANELVTESDGAIEVRWYRTHGEQFHTKLALIARGDQVIASIGSANLTRRNLGNYNLEANLAVAVPRTAPLAAEMQSYFDRLWNNEGAPGTEYTAPFGAFQDADRSRYWRYRFMEATGLSTF